MFNCTFILLSAEWKSLLYEGSQPPVRVKDYADLIIFRRYRRGGHHNVFLCCSSCIGNVFGIDQCFDITFACRSAHRLPVVQLFS